MIGNILRDDRPSSNKRVFTDGMAADNRAVGPQRGALPDERGPDLVHLPDFCPGVVDIGEDHRGAAEDAVFEGNALVDTYIVLDLASVADGDIRTDHAVLPDIAVLADLGPREDMGEVPDLCTFANFDIVVNDGGGMDEDTRKTRSHVIGGHDANFCRNGVMSPNYPCFLFFFH